MKIKLRKVNGVWFVEKTEGSETKRLDLVHPIYWWSEEAEHFYCAETPHKQLALAAIKVQQAIHQFNKIRDKHTGYNHGNTILRKKDQGSCDCPEEAGHH